MHNLWRHGFSFVRNDYFCLLENSISSYRKPDNRQHYYQAATHHSTEALLLSPQNEEKLLRQYTLGLPWWNQGQYSWQKRLRVGWRSLAEHSWQSQVLYDKFIHWGILKKVHMADHSFSRRWVWLSYQNRLLVITMTRWLQRIEDCKLLQNVQSDTLTVVDNASYHSHYSWPMPFKKLDKDTDSGVDADQWCRVLKHSSQSQAIWNH